MRNKSVWERACGLTETVVEDVEFDDMADAIVVAVRPTARARGRCGQCRRRSPRYDAGEGRRRWRALDLGHDSRVPRSESATSALPRAWGDRGVGAVGVSPCRPHPRLR